MKSDVIKRMVDANEIQTMLGVSKATIWRWRQQPKVGFPMPACLGSRSVRWRICDIDSWIDSNIQQKLNMNS